MINEKIIDKLKDILKEIGITVDAISVESPSDSSHGDYTTNVAFSLAKQLKKSPGEVAEAIAAKLQNNKAAEFEKIEAVNGFINFYLSRKYLLKYLEELIADEEKISLPLGEKKQTVVVEYSSPNIAKPFTIGHLRSTIIGDAVANLLEKVGYEVKRDNHVGDWGTQFGKQIYAIKNIPLIDIEEGENIEKKNVEFLEASERPVKNLVDLYVDFHKRAEINPELDDEAREWFKKLEEGDYEAKRLWQKCIEWSWKEFYAIYTELNVHFTENNGRGYGEAFFEDKMQPVMKELEDKHLLTENEGAKLVYFPEDLSSSADKIDSGRRGKLPPLMIIKKDGATLYATRDLATDNFRLEKYGKDVIIINEVGAEQSLYFQQLYLLEQMLGWFAPKQRIHIKHGLYRFADQKMSTRKGNVIWLEDVLEEAKQRALSLQKEPTEFGEKLAVEVGIGAIKWNDLKRSPHMDVTFDWNEILTMEGNSGSYVQYTYVRTHSILEQVLATKRFGTGYKPAPASGNTKRFEAGYKPAPAPENEEKVYNLQTTHYNLEPEEFELLRKLYQFEETINKAAANYSPNVLTQYLYELAKQFNLFYQKYRILNAEKGKEREFRIGLTKATGLVLKEGLRLLGIAAPEKM